MCTRTTWVICTVFWAAVFRLPTGFAQATPPITPSGLNTHVNLSAAPPAGTVQYDITGGTRSGTNLYHSFGDFGVPNNNIANFLNDSGSATSNILGRVTGGNVSNIFGTLQTTGFGNANLFLMNPAGIVFGPTASLNVGGSVTFTTADYLRLDKVGGSNAGIFHADPAQTSLLTSAPVDAFGFLGTNSAAITVQGSKLTVPEGQEISLIGGTITIRNGALEKGTIQPAHLSAPNGQINLATAKSPGEFLQDLTAAPNINGVSFRSFGSAHLEPGSTVDVSRTGSGKVSIRGGQLVLEIQSAVLDTADNGTSTAVPPSQDTIILAPGSSIISQTSSEDRGPDIQIVADRLQFIGSPPPHLSEETLGPKVNIWARTDGSGNAGNIALRTTGDLELINLVRLESTSGFTPDGKTASPVLASGNAGNVQLTSAHGNIRMTGIVTWATSQTDNSSGKTGTVTASALEGDIILDRANLFTHSSSKGGGGGQVEVTAKNLQMLNMGLLATDNFGPLKPPGITVTLSDKLTMAGGSFIVAGSLSPTGSPAGDINLTAKEILVTQGSLINNGTFASGPGGHLKIVTDTLQITDGGKLDNGSTAAPLLGQLPQGVTPSGAGGTITITGRGGAARSVVIDGAESQIVSNSQGAGVGGNIFVNANSVTLTNGASISASSTGSGNAGNIWLNAGQRLMVRDSSITTEANKAGGGNIDVIAIDRVHLANSRISTSVLEGSGDSGRISIDPNEVIVQNNSTILSQAVRGRGGDITITTPRFLQDTTSLVDASSQFGPSGKVTIQSSISNLSGTVAQLASKTTPAQALLQSRCVALAGGEQSTFIVAGRDALPSEPGGWLSSPVSMAHWMGEETEHASGLTVKRQGSNGSPPMVAPETETEVLSLRRLTPPGFLVRTFGIDGLTGCRS